MSESANEPIGGQYSSTLCSTTVLLLRTGPSVPVEYQPFRISGCGQSYPERQSRLRVVHGDLELPPLRHLRQVRGAQHAGHVLRLPHKVVTPLKVR